MIEISIWLRCKSEYKFMDEIKRKRDTITKNMCFNHLKQKSLSTKIGIITIYANNKWNS